MQKLDLILDTPRLTLRPFNKKDAKHMYKWTSDEKVTKFLLWYAHTSIKQTKAFIASVIAKARINPYDWMIVEKITALPIGSIGIDKINEQKRTCEVGYCLAKDYWGKGYMPEALIAVLSFLLHVGGFNEVFATHDIDNISSGKVMQKSGMVYYDTDKIYNEIKNEYVTVHCYKITK